MGIIGFGWSAWQAYRRQQQAVLAEVALWPAGTGLGRRDRYRMRSYALRAVLLCDLFFAKLRGQALSPTERKAMTCLGTVAPLLDDLFDRADHRAPEQHHALRAFAAAYYTRPQDQPPQNAWQAVVSRCLSEARTHIPDLPAFEAHCTMVVEAQLQSLRQYQPLDPQTCWQITRAKGGASFHYMTSPMQGTLPTELVMQFGGWIQLLDDLFDMAQDREDQIFTLPNAAESATWIEDFVAEQTRLLLLLVLQSAPDRQSRAALYHLVGLLYRPAAMHLCRLRSLASQYPRQPLSQWPVSAVRWREKAGYQPWYALRALPDFEWKILRNLPR